MKYIVSDVCKAGFFLNLRYIDMTQLEKWDVFGPKKGRITRK
jgi:hypothetical protein